MTYTGPLVPRYPMQHRVWVDTDAKDSHGNVIGELAEPVDRLFILCYPANRTLGVDDVVSPNVVARTETDIMVDVHDPETYHNRDQLIIDGIAFNIQGEPGLMGWDKMPFEGYASMVPSSIHCQRVT
jgi:hypothetical protein